MTRVAMTFISPNNDNKITLLCWYLHQNQNNCRKHTKYALKIRSREVRTLNRRANTCCHTVLIGGKVWSLFLLSSYDDTLRIFQENIYICLNGKQILRIKDNGHLSFLTLPQWTRDSSGSGFAHACSNT